MADYIHPISVKDLRSKMPFVRKQLEKGQTFMIIYQSIPIAELTPIQKTEYFKEATDKEVEAAAMEDWGGDAPYLSKEELDYYMSLPEID